MKKEVRNNGGDKGRIGGEKKYPKKDKTQYSNRMRFDVVVVLGMHRSGTSAITKGLELFGVDLGQNLLPANEYNPKGYFEDNQLVDINDNILRKSGSLWLALQFLEPADLLGTGFEKEQNEAREFLKGRLAQGTPIGLKDPRLCRTLPFWQKIFVEMGIRVGYLMPFRNPFEIAASLQRRDNLGIDYGLMLWGSYETDALRHTDGKPRLFIGFHQLLENSGRELARMSEFLETEWNPDAQSSLEYEKKFLDSDFRHHQENQRNDIEPAELHALSVALDVVCQKSDKQSLEDVENAGRGALVRMMQITDVIKLSNQILFPSSNSVELFYSKEQGDFCEKRKLINLFDKMSNSKEVINVSLSDEVGLAPYWRVDPGFRPGKIHFLGMKFLGPKGRVVWDLQDHREQVLVQGTAVKLSLPPVGVEVVSTGNDPNIILPALPAEALPVSSILVDIEINSTQEELGKLVQLQVQKAADLLQAVGDKDLQVEQIKTSLDAKEKEIAQAVKIDEKIEQIRQEMAADREESKLAVKKVEEERASSEKQSVSLQITLSQIRQEMEQDREESKLVVKKVEEERAQQRKAQQEAVEKSVGEVKKEIVAEIHSLIANLVEQGEKNRLEVSARIDSVKDGMEGRIIEVGEYAAKIREAVVSPSSYMIPVPFSWYSFLHKMLNIREPVWLNKEKESGEAPKRPGFWRRLERSIRKRRKRWIGGVGFDREWYLKEYPDIARGGIDPLDHYVQHGISEGRWKSEKQKKLYKFIGAAGILEYSIRKRIKNWTAQFGFDRSWYLKEYPDVKKSGMAPLVHYQQFGLKEGRSKNNKQECTLNEISARVKIKKRIRQMHSLPLISVIMPIYNPQPDWLKRAISSVRNQIYPHWQICLVDDASTNPKILKIIEEESADDSKITFRMRKNNGGISAASNEALGLARGEWVTFLDHDDEIKEDALFWIAHAINQYPEAALIYSDEDKIDKNGNRQCPHFKTQLNLGLLLSYNYMCHLLVVRKKIVDQVGGFREGFEGAQDYDLILRCMEKIDTSAVVHIPRILYHWRMHPQSTATGVDIKPLAEEAGRRAITEHLQRRGTPGTVSCVPGGYRVDFEITEKPKVSIIIPTHNQELLLKKCVESLLENTDYQNYQIILVDNKTTEPRAKALLKYYREQGLTVLSYESEFNYSRINNFAVQHAESELILFLNNDIEIIQKDWLEVMVRQISQPDVGAVGAKLLYPDGKLQHGGVILGIGGVAGHSHKNYPGNAEGYFSRCRLTQDLSAVTGACLLVKKRIFLNINGFEENYLTVAFNDVDLCLRLKAEGKRLIWTPFACLIHHESASRGMDGPQCKRFLAEIKYMRNKWDKILDQDPAYNPNLSLEAEDFQLSQIARLPQTWRL